MYNAASMRAQFKTHVLWLPDIIEGLLKRGLIHLACEEGVGLAG